MAIIKGIPDIYTIGGGALLLLGFTGGALSPVGLGTLAGSAAGSYTTTTISNSFGYLGGYLGNAYTSVDRSVFGGNLPGGW